MLDWIGAQEGPAGLAVIAAFSAVEYLFPPFPGDLAVVAGSFLVATRGWALLPVLAATIGGSLVGALCNYWVGRWLGARRWEPSGPRGRRLKAATLAVVERFEKHGAAYIAVNRFLPAIRSVFFLAAGWARMPVLRVVAWGAVSALAWNLLLVGAAFLVGREWDLLVDIVRTYSVVAWCIVAAAIVGIALRWRRKR